MATTVPIDCRSKLWKLYVDDVLEIVKQGSVDQLTEHLNKADDTGSIKFTHEPEKEKQIPFLDTLLIRKPDGEIKLLIYRKPTHTDQYLNLNSHHPLQHKLGVVRTLLDRAERIVTDPKDRQKEEDHIRNRQNITNQLIDIPDTQLIPVKTPTRGNNKRFTIPYTRTTLLKGTFFPDTIRLWNALSQQVVDSPSVDVFKTRVKDVVFS
ncbi:uncharacterized protein [Amphiura filiformis]|uniref:uncharacterized protein n=1 Tax=Amphiura filiformis TaxID=82378 RepID=UPI003B22053F